MPLTILVTPITDLIGKHNFEISKKYGISEKEAQEFKNRLNNIVDNEEATDEEVEKVISEIEDQMNLLLNK